MTCVLCAGCQDDAQELEPDAVDASTVDTSAAVDAGILVIADASNPRSDVTRPAVLDAASDAGEVPPWRVLHPSFEQALRVETDGAVSLVDEQSADQVDYFVFRGRAGSYYELSTDRGDYTPDNTLELFDAQRRKLAANDDGSRFPGDAIDARLVVRLPADGEYYVRVEDLHTPAEFFSTELPLLYYRFSARELTASSEGYAFWREGAPLPFVDDRDYGYRYVTVLGELSAAGAMLTLDSPVANALIARIHAGGVTGNGSSVSTGSVQVVSVSKRVSEIQRAEYESFHPPVAAGAVLVTIEAPAPLGGNPIYAVDLVLLKDNPGEQAEPNDRADRAETVTLSRASVGRGLLLSRLPAGDVDLWRIPVTTASKIIFSCEAQSGGSGVRGLRAELLDTQLKRLTDASEDEEGLDGEYVGTQQGPLYLRLTGAGVEADIDPWARCVVIAN